MLLFKHMEQIIRLKFKKIQKSTYGDYEHRILELSSNDTTFADRLVPLDYLKALIRSPSCFYCLKDKNEITLVPMNINGILSFDLISNFYTIYYYSPSDAYELKYSYHYRFIITVILMYYFLYVHYNSTVITLLAFCWF